MEKGDLIYTEPYTDFATGQMIVSIAKPFTMDGEQAVILADITIDSLIEMVKSVGTDESVQTFLLAEDNSVITHENKEYLPKEEGNTVLSDVLDIDLEKDNVSTFRDYDGISKYYAVWKVATTGWRLGITQPTSVISSKIRSNLMLPLAVDIIFLVVFIVLLNIVVNRLLKPLAEMKAFIKEKVIGTKNCRAEKNEVKEISYLIEELESRVISTIQKTQQETEMIRDMISGTDSHVSDMNGNIMEISAIMEETGASVTSQTESISDIDKNCRDVAQAMDELVKNTQSITVRAKEIIVRVEQMIPGLLEDKENAISVTLDSKKSLESAIEETKVIGEIDKVNELVKKVMESVDKLSDASSKVITFLDEIVLKDYDKLETLADSYKEDATYYVEVSNALGSHTENLNASIANINEIIDTIDTSQKELDGAVQSVNENLQRITNASENVSAETKDVMRSIASLQSTVEQFNL